MERESPEGMLETQRTEHWTGSLMISVKQTITKTRKTASVMLTAFDPKMNDGAGGIKRYAEVEVKQREEYDYRTTEGKFAAPVISWSSYGGESYKRAAGMIRMLTKAQEIAEGWNEETGMVTTPIRTTEKATA